MAERVARGLGAHGVRGPFDLVGPSLGGGIALVLAATRPKLVARLVLLAPAGLDGPSRRGVGPVAAGAEPLFAARRRPSALTDFDWGRQLLLAFTVADGPPSRRPRRG